jgi:hypothetical protein
MPIKGDDAKPDLATIKGKFELRLYERRGSSTSFVTSVAFTEIRLARSNPIAKHGF